MRWSRRPSSYPCTSPHTIGPVPNGSEYYFLLFPTDAAGNQGSTEIWPIVLGRRHPGHDAHRRTDPRHRVRSDDPDRRVVLVHVLEGRVDVRVQAGRAGRGDTATTRRACRRRPTARSSTADTRSGSARPIPAGIVASPAVRSFTVDTIAPETSITAGPSGATSVTSAVFSFASTQPHSYFSCRLDGPGAPGSSIPCISGETAFDDDRERHLHVLGARHGCERATSTRRPRRARSRSARRPSRRRRHGDGDADRDGDRHRRPRQRQPPPRPRATATASATASPTATRDRDVPPRRRSACPAHPTGSVPATLSLSLSSAPDLGPFVPAVAKDYETSLVATVTSTAGDAVLSVADPSATSTGRLSNGSFTLTRRDPGAGRERRLRSGHRQREPAHAAGLQRADHRRPGDDRAQTGDPRHRSAANGDLQHGADVHAVDRDALTRRRGCARAVRAR